MEWGLKSGGSVMLLEEAAKGREVEQEKIRTVLTEGNNGGELGQWSLGDSGFNKNDVGILFDYVTAII